MSGRTAGTCDSSRRGGDALRADGLAAPSSLATRSRSYASATARDRSLLSYRLRRLTCFEGCGWTVRSPAGPPAANFAPLPGRPGRRGSRNSGASKSDLTGTSNACASATAVRIVMARRPFSIAWKSFSGMPTFAAACPCVHPFSRRSSASRRPKSSRTRSRVSRTNATIAVAPLSKTPDKLLVSR